MKKLLTILFISIFLISMVSALQTQETLKPAKVNNEYYIIQVCDDATYINFTLSNLNGLVLSNSEMTSNGSGMFYYLYTPGDVGRYDVSGISDGCEGTFATYFETTPTGYVGTIGFYFVLLALVGGLIILGFKAEEYWFLVLSGLGLMILGIYTVNNGIADYKDMFMTWAVGIFEIGVGAALSIGAGIHKMRED